MTINMNSCLSVNPSLVLRVEDDDCALLFDPDNGRVQMLNSTAVDIWQLFDGKRTLRDIVECLGNIYDNIDDDIDRQVLATAENFASLGAVGVWEKS